MTSSIQELLDSFDRLPEVEKRDAVYEILRRVRQLDVEPISDDELVLSAEELFLDLDRREEANERA